MKRIRKNIEKDIWLYISWCLAMVLLWIWIFGFLTQVKPENKVSIFSGTYSTQFEKYDEINLEYNRPAGIEVVAVNAYDVREDSFYAVLQVLGYGEADILILPKSQIDGHTFRFAPISATTHQQLATGGYTLGVYQEDDISYGMKIYDSASGESLISWLCFDEADEDFYLLFNADSVHIEPAYDIYTKDSAAFYVALQLLKV